MTSPWERELEQQKRQASNAYIEISVSDATAKTLRTRPRAVFFTAIATGIGVALALFMLYVEVKHNLDNGTSGYESRIIGWNRYSHSAWVIFTIFLPLSLYVSSLTVRYLLMKSAATEISTKVARKLKCTPEFELAVFRMVVKTPWSVYRFNRTGAKGNGRRTQIVTTEAGESRSLEFRDKFSQVVIGPQRWVGRKRKTAWDEIVEEADRYGYY